MLDPTFEQIIAAQKGCVETVIGLTDRAFESFEKLVSMNMHMVKGGLADSDERAKQVLAANTMQELLVIQARVMQSINDRFMSYCQQVYEIVAGTHGEFSALTEAAVDENTRKMEAIMAQTSGFVPVGSENSLAVLKAAIGAANAAYGSANDAMKHALAVAQGSLTSVVANGTDTAVTTPAKPAKKSSATAAHKK